MSSRKRFPLWSLFCTYHSLNSLISAFLGDVCVWFFFFSLRIYIAVSRCNIRGGKASKIKLCWSKADCLSGICNLFWDGTGAESSCCTIPFLFDSLPAVFLSRFYINRT